MTQEEFEHIAPSLRDVMLSVGRSFFDNESDADYVAQEGLLALWKYSSRMDADAVHTALAIRIAKHCCMDIVRKRKTTIPMPEDYGGAALNNGTAQSPQEIMEQGELLAAVDNAINRLTPSERRLYELRQIEGLPLNDIVKQTNISKTSVKSMISAARKKIYENGIPKELEFYQANLWLDLFELYKEYSDRIDRVTMWSITDKLSSTNETSGFDRTDYGNIFDRNFQAKPQYWAIADPEYYLKEILKDDTSKLRFEFNGNTNVIEESDTFEENGALYVETGELLSTLTDIKYVINGERVSVIRNGVYYELNAEKDIIMADFNDYEFEKPVIRRNGKVYVSYEDLLEMIGYGSNYSEQRNLVTISEYQLGGILDEINKG